VANLIGVRDQALPSGAKPLDMFSNLVLQVGTLGANAKADAAASGMGLQQVTDQRGAVSGVSLDEETTNMIRYQRAYQAAARVITTVNSMYDTLLSMGLGG
jgi:flagellar hook-associated protein 1 FlgK